LNLPAALAGQVRSWPSFRLAPDRTEPRSQSRSSSRVRRLVPSTVTGWPAITDGLDGELARLQQWPRREDGPFAHARRVAALSWCGELPGVRYLRPPPCAAAVRRAAARGAAVSRGRDAPAFCSMRRLSRRYRMRGHASPGARRAPRALETCRESFRRHGAIGRGNRVSGSLTGE